MFPNLGGAKGPKGEGLRRQDRWTAICSCRTRLFLTFRSGNERQFSHRLFVCKGRRHAEKRKRRILLNDNRSNHTGARSITGAAETTRMEPAMVVNGDGARREGKGYRIPRNGASGLNRLVGAAVKKTVIGLNRMPITVCVDKDHIAARSNGDRGGVKG